MLKKVSKDNVHISTIEITSKKVRGNHVDFSTSEITSKKVRGNYVNFSTIEITSKKYAGMTWKFVEIWSSMYRRNIHVESTSIRRGVPYFIYIQVKCGYNAFANVSSGTDVEFKNSGHT